uniref:Chemokine (C-C motif) ligand 34b, duplicate 4 n=1 Tax=Sinocyclocheilus anshuiensis TaxID=1608454 RepID=A0A671MWN0_9TELE
MIIYSVAKNGLKTTIILFIAIISVKIFCKTKSYHRPTHVGVNCCKDVTKARIPPATKLIGYKQQNALSPCMDAIIRKSSYCSDPKSCWIQDSLKGTTLTLI